MKLHWISFHVPGNWVKNSQKPYTTEFGKKGKTWVMNAVEKEDKELVKQLVKANADLELTYGKQLPAIWRTTDISMVSLLLELNANPVTKGLSPLNSAQISGNSSCDNVE